MAEPRPAETHRCPDPGCSATGVPRRHFACPADWARLPDAHQEAILTGYNTRGSDGAAAHHEAMVRAVQWYSDHPLSSRPPPRSRAAVRGARGTRAVFDEATGPG